MPESKDRPTVVSDSPTVACSSMSLREAQVAMELVEITQPMKMWARTFHNDIDVHCTTRTYDWSETGLQGRKIEFVGLCVEKRIAARGNLLSFYIDDSSGCVRCTLWKSKAEQNGIYSKLQDSGLLTFREPTYLQRPSDWSHEGRPKDRPPSIRHILRPKPPPLPLYPNGRPRTSWLNRDENNCKRNNPSTPTWKYQGAVTSTANTAQDKTNWQIATELVQIGSLFRVQGVPTYYAGEKELIITYVFHERDPNMETWHWLDLMELYEELAVDKKARDSGGEHSSRILSVKST